MKAISQAVPFNCFRTISEVETQEGESHPEPSRRKETQQEPQGNQLQDLSSLNPGEMALVYPITPELKPKPAGSLDDCRVEELKNLIFLLRRKFSTLERAKDMLISKIRDKDRLLNLQQQQLQEQQVLIDSLRE